jgi:hypothetical protein
MKKALLIIIIILAAAGFGIYKLANSVGAAGEKADAVIATFHASLKKGDAAAIHKAAAPSFQSSVPLSDFQSMVTMMTGKLGEWKSGERSGINLTTNNGNTQLEIGMDSKFANGDGAEEFVFDYNGDEPKLIGWHVKSPLLIEKPAAPAEAAPPETPANP